MQPLHVWRKRRVEVEQLARVGMLEGEVFGVQRLAVQI
jgi:hypothetical protein